jgi:type II secretory pathway component PulC
MAQKNNDIIRNPFQDYRVNKYEEETSITIKNNANGKDKDDSSKLILPFKWKGIIFSNKSYIVLVVDDNKSYLVQKGDMISGFKLIEVSLEKLIFVKEGKKVVTTIRSDQLE